MLYYAKDHALTRDSWEVLASIECFLELATPATRAPTSIRATQAAGEGSPAWKDGIALKSGIDFAPRLDAILSRVRQARGGSACAFSIHWVPDFVHAGRSAFDALGIDALARQGGGRFVHSIALTGRSARAPAQPDYAMISLALPFDAGSDAFEPFVAEANRRLCFKLSRLAFRQLVPTKAGGFRTVKLPGGVAAEAQDQRDA